MVDVTVNMVYECSWWIWVMDVGCKHGWQMWLVNVVHKTWCMNPVCKYGLSLSTNLG